MAKVQPKKQSSPLKWVLIGGGLIVVYLVAFPGDSAPAKTAAKPPAKKKSAGEEIYTAQDIQRSQHPYDPLKVPVVNAFKPVVFRPVGGVVSKTLASFGGNGWTYSGMAVVDGKKQGMLENDSTGESVLLQKNDNWSGAKVGDIEADHMVLMRPDGPITVRVEEAKDTSENSSGSTASTALPAPMAPLPVPMAGPIGTGDPNVSVVQDDSLGTGTGRGNGRRRRRNAG